MTRTIKTTYYRGKELVRTNTAAHSTSAVARAVDHLQQFHYNATLAEVYDSATGKLHAVLKMNTKQLVIVYKREPNHE